MKALRVERLTDDLSGVALTDIAMPEPGPDEVLVRVRASSLNYPDLLMTRGAYQFKPEPPFTSGMELAGEVVSAPDGSSLPVGQAVMGGAKTGGFAEYVALPARAVRPIPPGMDFASAASLGTAYTTAWTALVEQGGLREGQWVLVHGASGGVGLAACDLARALGARVIAATHDAAKVDLIRDAVSPEAVIVNRGRFREDVAELTGGALCDLVYDPVGGDVFDESTRCVAFGGKLLVIGFVAGRIPEIAVNIPLIKGFSIVGVRAGEFARRFPERGAAIAAEIARLAGKGVIRPIIDRVLPLKRWRVGFDAMAGGQLVGKVVFEP
ncbi:Phthiocerol synthesis polyketide synthase type I PpsC [Tsuneonella dongtanensis]|uniref:Phthiocerol synthesis polyketide synthase type I PpsC n=1 Tax=Tsuneonella dongtanensis TaxID=692370 RepID=A0A1B2AFH4_9SPHN|nr:NADPH:quinone oxidoreductase family protein [Tsuneonella dongtanensis]ANY20903.1 Phthiocerol synthesis polyketide synthase type I PpsC [Tsuneonella dongtanensis]